jgi:hypothetical protein
MDRHTFLTVVSLAALLLPQPILGNDDLLRCGGMEGPYQNGMATSTVIDLDARQVFMY